MSKKNIILTAALTMAVELLTLFIHTDLKLISDWVGEMALPSYLAGRDWSSVLSTCSYYGWGLTWIYTPIFWLSSNPAFIWYAYRIISILVISVIAVMIYIIQIRCLKQKENVASISIAVALATLTWIDFGKETTLILGIWVSAFLFLETFYEVKPRSNKSKVLFSMVTPAVTCYVKNAHESAICLSLALFFFAFWDYFVKRKKSVYIIPFLASWSITYVLSNMVKSRVLNLYQSGVERDYIANTSAFATVKVWFLDTWEGFKFFLTLVWSNFFTLTIWTYGLALASVVICAASLIRAFKKRNLRNIDEDRPLIGMIFFGIIASAIVVAGVAVVWGYGLGCGVTIGGKAYNYYRYYLPFFFPALLGCLAYFRNDIKNMARIKCAVMILLSLSMQYYLVYLYPQMLWRSEKRGGILWENMYVISFNESNDNLQNICTWFVFIVFFLIVLFWIKSEKKYVLLMLFVGAFAITARRTDVDLDGVKENRFAVPSFEVSICDASVKIIPLLIEDDVDREDIIVVDFGGFYAYTLQFALNRFPLKFTDSVEGLGSNSIIFSGQGDLQNYIGEEYHVYSLDEEEYLYTQNIEVIEQVNSWLTERVE